MVVHGCTQAFKKGFSDLTYYDFYASKFC